MNNIGLYIHIPFCKRKCLYCDFYSVTDTALIVEYEKALERQLNEFVLPLSNRVIDSIYIGGGTPSLLDESIIKKLLDYIRNNFSVSDNCEITLEANPDSADEKKLFGYRKAGINRLSIGMQSSFDKELLLLGRLHNHRETEACVKNALSAGFDNISLDLMFALPGQSKGDFIENVKRAVSLSPRHISFYCLTLSEKVKLYKLKNEIADEDIQREMYFETIEFLEKNGFYQYEISNAAKPGFESRHNLKYWKREEYIGLGAGAHSFIDNKRFYTLPDINQYVNAKSFSPLYEECRRLSKEEAAEEYIILSLRLCEGIDLKDFEKKHNDYFIKKIERLSDEFEFLCSKSLCEKTGTGYRLTKEGFFVSNEILTRLI